MLVRTSNLVMDHVIFLLSGDYEKWSPYVSLNVVHVLEPDKCLVKYICQVDTVLSVSVCFMFHPMLELWDAHFSFVKCCKLLYRVPFEFVLFLVLQSYAWLYLRGDLTNISCTTNADSLNYSAKNMNFEDHIVTVHAAAFFSTFENEGELHNSLLLFRPHFYWPLENHILTPFPGNIAKKNSIYLHRSSISTLLETLEVLGKPHFLLWHRVRSSAIEIITTILRIVKGRVRITIVVLSPLCLDNVLL